MGGEAAGVHPWANSYCALTVLGGTTVSASPVMKRVGTLTEQPAHCDGCCATATLTSKVSIAVALEAVPIVAPPPMECPTTPKRKSGVPPHVSLYAAMSGEEAAGGWGAVEDVGPPLAHPHSA